MRIEKGEKDIVSEKYYRDNSPIVAVASSAGMSAIGVIRSTGHGVRELIEPLIQYKGSKRGDLVPRKMTYVGIRNPESGVVIDDVLICYFKGPGSFTGEDMIEIYPHGGPYIISTLLQLLLSQGMRQAEGGEFSRRAFLNGKIDLCAAEGIRGMTEAVSLNQWIAAREMATGRLSKHINLLRDSLVNAMAFLEARIDFPEEEEVQESGMARIKDMVASVASALDQLLASFQSGRIAAEGFRVALVGVPNVGKSSLLNAFLDQGRAIVTDVPGTTRDYLEEKCLLKGRLVRLIDTAGIRSTHKKVEMLGIERSLEISKSADLALFLTDTGSVNTQMQKLLEDLSDVGIPIEKIYTKSDLGLATDRESHSISAKFGHGIDTLVDIIVGHIDSVVKGLSDQSITISSSRHQVAIAKAKLALERFFDAYNRALFDECLAFELRDAARSLESIVGHIEQDDVLEVIFRSFCIGK